MKLRSPVLSLRARSTAVVVLILFAAGILITYFNAVTTQRMEFHDSESDARLMLNEFNLTTNSPSEVDIGDLIAKAKLELRLNADARYIGFFKSVGADSVSLVAFASQNVSDSEITLAEQRLRRRLPESSAILGNSLYYHSKLLQRDGQVWGYALIKISLEQVQKSFSRTG